MQKIHLILRNVPDVKHVRRLENAIRSLDGVHGVALDVHQNMLYVTYDPQKTSAIDMISLARTIGVEAKALAEASIPVDGMTCAACRKHVSDAIAALPGVKKADVSLESAKADVSFDPEAVSRAQIDAAIVAAGYAVPQERLRNGRMILRTGGILLLIAALYWLVESTGLLTMLAPSTLVTANMGLGMLFIVGLTTSVHCVAMCGGICLSQCIRPQAVQSAKSKGDTVLPAVLYNGGRVLSYTVIGLLVGALGSVLTLSPTVQGILKLIAGLFMVAMGLRMLGLFPWLARLMPNLTASLYQKGNKAGGGRGPFVVGLLNGLMPCGPLQAMQLYALSTGSAVFGAISMLAFGLGTVPLLLAFGVLGTALGRRFSGRLMMAGAVVVAVLGLSMLTQGASLAGVSPIVASQSAASTGTVQSVPAAVALDSDIQPIETIPSALAVAAEPSPATVQHIESTLSARAYPNITVQAGVPVEWNIVAPKGSINGCNGQMIIPEYGITHDFTEGDNLITFTPDQTGTFQYSCWMGMIRATITVTDTAAAPTAAP
jgi:copper ion binding protein